MTRAATVLALVLALVLAGVLLPVARALSARHAACQDQQSSTGVATNWTPWGGCHATIFGTDLKVGN